MIGLLVASGAAVLGVLLVTLDPAGRRLRTFLPQLRGTHRGESRFSRTDADFRLWPGDRSRGRGRPASSDRRHRPGRGPAAHRDAAGDRHDAAGGGERPRPRSGPHPCLTLDEPGRRSAHRDRAARGRTPAHARRGARGNGRSVGGGGIGRCPRRRCPHPVRAQSPRDRRRGAGAHSRARGTAGHRHRADVAACRRAGARAADRCGPGFAAGLSCGTRLRSEEGSSSSRAGGCG